MYEVVKRFEQKVANYAGSLYGVAVDSCTNALFLSLFLVRPVFVHLPKKTYVGVAQAVINSGAKIIWEDIKWEGVYRLNPSPIVDSARRFRKGMYENGTLYCLSFHEQKHLPIGRGGMILTNDWMAYQQLRKMRFDGRTEGVPPKEDVFTTHGFHCYMKPDDAARGLMLMSAVKDDNLDLLETEYPDLSENFQVTGGGMMDRYNPIPGMFIEPNGEWYKADEADKRIKKLEEALKEIKKGEGRYDRDPLTHCGNTVEDMKQIATEALKEGEDG